MKKTTRKGTPGRSATGKKTTKAALKKSVKKAATAVKKKKAGLRKVVKKAVRKSVKKTAKKVVKKAAKKAAAKAKTSAKKVVKRVVKKIVKKTATAAAPPKKSPRPARPKSFPAHPVEKNFGFSPGVPDLPDAYGDNRLVLMTKDPEYLFAYWEVTPERLAESGKAKRSGEEYREAMRLNWEPRDLFETNFAVLPVELDARKWYLKVPYAGISYHVEIGWLGEDGHFVPVLASNPSDAPETWETTRLRLNKGLKGLADGADDVLDYQLRVTQPLGSSDRGAVERVPVPPAVGNKDEYVGPGSLSSSFGTKPRGSRRAPKPRGPRK